MSEGGKKKKKKKKKTHGVSSNTHAHAHGSNAISMGGITSSSGICRNQIRPKSKRENETIIVTTPNAIKSTRACTQQPQLAGAAKRNVVKSFFLRSCFRGFGGRSIIRPRQRDATPLDACASEREGICKNHRLSASAPQGGTAFSQNPVARDRDLPSWMSSTAFLHPYVTSITRAR